MTFIWQRVEDKTDCARMDRAMVPGGWLVRISYYPNRETDLDSYSIAFYPDPQHQWNGGTLTK